MKGLDEYIAKHGKHFTEELAYRAAGSKRWTSAEIHRALQKKVYYNVSGCTSDDIAYLVNGMGFTSKRDFISFLMRCIFYEVDSSDRNFDMWVIANKDFDLTPYI